jgi:hypothetical protein
MFEDKHDRYVVIIIACLIILIALVSILYYKLDNISCHITQATPSGFANIERPQTFTEAEIRQMWMDTGCTKPLTKDIVTLLSYTPKDYIKRTIKYYQGSNTRCYNKKKYTYTPAQIKELQNIWNTTGCTASYPIYYVNQLQENKPYSSGKKEFTQYALDVVKNNEDNSIDLLDLKRTNRDCYGPDWEKNVEVYDHYNTIKDN